MGHHYVYWHEPISHNAQTRPPSSRVYPQEDTQGLTNITFFLLLQWILLLMTVLTSCCLRWQGPTLCIIGGDHKSDLFLNDFNFVWFLTEMSVVEMSAKKCKLPFMVILSASALSQTAVLHLQIEYVTHVLYWCHKESQQSQFIFYGSFNKIISDFFHNFHLCTDSRAQRPTCL